MGFGIGICYVLMWNVLVCSVVSENLDFLDTEIASEDQWMFRSTKRQEEIDKPCSRVRPNARDIVKRFYAILPYFDKEHANTAFLHKFRGNIYGMAQGDELLDREASYYATVLTPIIFLQQYRDTWCLLERFHRALRLYQISHPSDKRTALKLLQNFRSVNAKIQSFILGLHKTSAPRHTTLAVYPDEEELHDKKDIRYLKELIKNLG